jgi:hypothetical protein
MRKSSAVLIVLTGFLTGICFWAVLKAHADDNAQATANQVLNDEGYGNDDEEYYNSDDVRDNGEGISSHSMNSSTDAQ